MLNGIDCFVLCVCVCVDFSSNSYLMHHLWSNKVVTTQFLPCVQWKTNRTHSNAFWIAYNMTLFIKKNMRNEYQRHLKHDVLFSLRDDNWFFFAFMCLLATIIIHELFFFVASYCACYYTGCVFVHLLFGISLLEKMKRRERERAREQMRVKTCQNVNDFRLRIIFPHSILMVTMLVVFIFLHFFFSDSWIFFST